MAIQNQPTRIQIPFADSGTKNVIPDTNPTPSASQAASWTDGFPAQCSLPLSAGGIPPARADFNGILNAMTQSIRYGQEGGVWTWSAAVDYGVNRMVLGSDGLLYWSVAQSGPNVGGAQDPTTDDGTYWGTPSIPTMPAGDNSQAAATTSFVGAAINNIAIPVGTVLWSANSAVPSGYLLCNGATVGRTTYSALFAAIGTTYGAGDGSTTFALPNLIGRVMWGGTSPGQYLAAGLPNISYVLFHVLTDGYENVANGALTNVSTYSFDNYSHDGGGSHVRAQNWTVSAQAASPIYGNSDTVQPPAITLLPCIKY